MKPCLFLVELFHLSRCSTKPFTRKMEGNGKKNVILARIARTRL
jgi:hypothetical protein